MRNAVIGGLVGGVLFATVYVALTSWTKLDSVWVQGLIGGVIFLATRLVIERWLGPRGQG